MTLKQHVNPTIADSKSGLRTPASQIHTNFVGKLKSQSGQTLIVVLIGLVIAGILASIMMSISDMQNKSIKFFQQKSDSIELKAMVAQAMNNIQICTWQFYDSGQTIDTTATKPDGSLVSTIHFNKLYYGTDNTAPELVSVGQSLSGLKVSEVIFQDIRPTGVPDQFRGDLKVTFTSTGMSRSIAPIFASINILIDSMAGSASARPILACGFPVDYTTTPSGPGCIGYMSVPSGYSGTIYQLCGNRNASAGKRCPTSAGGATITLPPSYSSNQVKDCSSPSDLSKVTWEGFFCSCP
ncbi:type IV pilus modification PilV family protein [Bdellovibrio sp. HCB337]|uniref:type IV pilus modification PilV family protein n=1 Tax=Bdellovibrio sp. HCB337 TaxID=3394358 RepID=UPI0039A52C6A